MRAAERNAYGHNVRVNFLCFAFSVFAIAALLTNETRTPHASTKMKSTKINEFHIRKLCFGFPLDVNKNLIYCKCIFAPVDFFPAAKKMPLSCAVGAELISMV